MRASQQVDLKGLTGQLKDMTEYEIRNFCDSTINAAVLGQDIFKTNFPDGFESWVKQVVSDEEGERRHGFGRRFEDLLIIHERRTADSREEGEARKAVEDGETE